MRRRVLLALVPTAALAQDRLRPLRWDAPEAAPLLARLRAGGVTLFFRHADTRGEPCDRSFRVGDRAGQRNISPRGRAQSREIGARMAALEIAVERPALAGPVCRARDTAEEMLGAEAVEVTDSLLADDFSGPRLDWVLAEHRRLFAAPVPPGRVRVLVGHRTPAIMVLGDAVVGGRAFPEGGALLLERGVPLGIIEFAPVEGGGFHGC